ncbi:MAG: helix-turn-helix transcriptional regulator [Candidatus Saccharimonadales bacterium]|jgi:transcriptional regulator with XRE-family HTH domain
MSKTQPEGSMQQLGKTLKALRERARESLAEASGAVEIDVKQLASFELGHNRPSEDVLLLLISHFGVRDDEAVRLWRLAGYGISRVSSMRVVNDKPQSQLPAGNHDPRILFTDIVDIMVNNYGVVMNFMQSTGPNAKPASVARVGMSREHAKSVLQILQVTLSQTEKQSSGLPKKLIAPDTGTPENSA